MIPWIRRVFVITFLFSSLSFNSYLTDPPSPFAHDEEEWAALEAFMRASPDTALTVLNGNLWMLPGPLAVDKGERMKRFVNLVHRVQPHVITLQEIWTTDWIDSLAVALPAYTVFASRPEGSLNKGGLVTMARLPGESVGFTPFTMTEATSTLERQAQKGFLTVRLETPTRKLHLVNTHLYAPTGPAERPLVAAQFEILKQIRSESPVLIAGDLNVPQSDFDRLNNGFFSTEPDTAATCHPDNPYANLGVNAFRPANRLKLDRFLIPHAHADLFTLTSRLIRTPLVSDHYLLAYRIVWKEKEWIQ